MRNSARFLPAAAILMALAIPLLAGGFYLTLGNPQASPEARSHNAVLTFKPTGCHNPEKAAVTATAIGLVDGRRESIPLKLIPLPEPGMYAVTRQWPTNGRWVLQVIATDHDRVTSALAPVDPNGAVDRNKAKFALGSPSESTIAALLESTPREQARK